MGNSKIVYGGRALIDLTNDTVTAENLKAGETAHDKAGNPIVGTLETGAYDVTSTDNGDGTQTLEIIDGGGSSGGFTPPAVGFVPSAWDANGYVTDGTWYGTTVPDYMFYNSYDGLPWKFNNIEFKDIITGIGNYSFTNCTNLVFTSLPESVTSIGEAVFEGCTNLALTSLPAGVTNIGVSSFFRCTNLALTSLPDGLNNIPNYAFGYCTNLALTSLPESVTSIGNYTFENCNGITNLTFEGTPTSVGKNAFYGCTNLTTINVPWSEGEVANAPWGATNATINYNYTGV